MEKTFKGLLWLIIVLSGFGMFAIASKPGNEPQAGTALIVFTLCVVGRTIIYQIDRIGGTIELTEAFTERQAKIAEQQLEAATRLNEFLTSKGRKRDDQPSS